MTDAGHERQRDLPPIGIGLKQLDGLIDEQFERTIGRYGFSRRQWQILNLLARGPASAAELAERLAPFVASGEDLDSLVAGGLVTADDGFALTALGQGRLEVLRQEVNGTRALVVQGLEEGEYERAVRTLLRMIRNLEDASSDGASPDAAP